MPRFYLILGGTSKQDPALLNPCEGAKFFFDPSRNQHLLDGGEVSMERFNQAAPDLIRNWPEMNRFYLIPRIELDPEEANLLETLESQQRTIDDLKRRLEKPRKLTPELAPA